MKHLSAVAEREAATGKYKTRNIYSLPLSLSLALSLSLLQNIILLFCYLVQHIPLVGALTWPVQTIANNTEGEEMTFDSLQVAAK